MDIKPSIINEMYLEILHGLSGIRASSLYNQEVTLNDLLSAIEGELLNRVRDIGDKFCKLNDFLLEVYEAEFGDDPPGLYILSFAEQLDKCLQPYRDALTALELEEPSLQRIYAKLFPFLELLDGLNPVVKDVKLFERKGVLILQTLHQHYLSSVRAVQLALQLIIRGVSRVLFNQLQLWLFYGEISDRRSEFFIKRVDCSDLMSSCVFGLDNNLIPSFIRMGLALKILNVGSTVWLLRTKPNNLGKEVKSSEEVNCVHFVDKTGIIQGNSKRIAQQLLDVVNAEIWRQWELMEPVVDSVQALVTTQLHYHAMTEANLMGQIQLVKDLFLMGRGELFHEFVTQCEGRKDTDYTLVLINCARKVLFNEEALKPFSLEGLQREDGHQMRFVYSAPWPLQLLFTEEIIDAYNTIFRFLLRLKRIQVKMGAAWVREKARRSDSAGSKRQQLLQQLWFVVNNLQYYLQVDVLDSQFLALEEGMRESKNFEEIQTCHRKFLVNLTTHSFVGNPFDQIANPVYQRIGIILRLCEDYCLELESTELTADRIDFLSNHFDASFEYLLALLSAVSNKASHPCSQHLTQLLLRLDFNYYFTKKFAEISTFATQ